MPSGEPTTRRFSARAAAAVAEADRTGTPTVARPREFAMGGCGEADAAVPSVWDGRREGWTRP